MGMATIGFYACRTITTQRRNPTMATDFRMALEELLDKRGASADFLCDSLERLVQLLMEIEVSSQIGADRHERTPERVTHRNGYRERAWETRVGTINLRIPKLRQGSYFPSLLEPRRRAEKALGAVIQEAYILGVSTRKVDELVQAVGMTGSSKSEVARGCPELGELVGEVRNRPVAGVDAEAGRGR